MTAERVAALLRRGRRLSRHWPAAEPLLLAECVPGGTSTALAVLQGLGIEAHGLVGGSLLQPVHNLKQALALQGLEAAGLQHPPAPPAAAAHALAVLAAVGDPMQALAAGLCLGLAERGLPMVLGGGSQMAAVLALALALAPAPQRPALAQAAVVATTAWLAHESTSDLQGLLERIGAHWQVEPRLAVARLRFHGCRSRSLRDYEQGHVKEGVGAGACAWLWELSGRSPASLAAACDRAAAQLLHGGLSG